MFHSIPLQRAQVVRVAQLGPQLFEDGPVPLLPLAADLALEVSLEIGGDVIVVDERVVHVDQEYDRMRATHRLIPWTGTGLCTIASRLAYLAPRKHATHTGARGLASGV